jgi:serine/threonine protein kinase
MGEQYSVRVINRPPGDSHHWTPVSEPGPQWELVGARGEQGDGASSRFELAELIGRGGLAEVFRAKDCRLNRPVAVKRLKDPSNDDDRAAIEREARLWASIPSHRGVVVLLDEQQIDGALCLILELEREDLNALRRRTLLAPKQSFRIGADLAFALAHLHANGIVHCDVSAANTLANADGGARLTDFSIAVKTDTAGRARALGEHGYYSPPEQANGGWVTPASDVYALVRLMVECLLSRRTDLLGGTERAQLRQLGVSAEAVNCLASGLDVQERRPSAQALAKIFEREWVRLSSIAQSACTSEPTPPEQAACLTDDTVGSATTRRKGDR